MTLHFTPQGKECSIITGSTQRYYGTESDKLLANGSQTLVLIKIIDNLRDCFLSKEKQNNMESDIWMRGRKILNV